jgi:hypothetical protein
MQSHPATRRQEQTQPGFQVSLALVVRVALGPAHRLDEFYAHRPTGWKLIETHIAWVFLAGPLVYKVKKPVVFPFLDYETLERQGRGGARRGLGQRCPSARTAPDRCTPTAPPPVGETWYGRFWIGNERTKRSIGPKRQAGTSSGLTRRQAEQKLRRQSKPRTAPD